MGRMSKNFKFEKFGLEIEYYWDDDNSVRLDKYKVIDMAEFLKWYIDYSFDRRGFKNEEGDPIKILRNISEGIWDSTFSIINDNLLEYYVDDKDVPDFVDGNTIYSVTGEIKYKDKEK